MTLRGRITWRGLTLGRDTPYGITSVEGWEDLPATADGSTAHAGDHGESLGDLLAAGRTVTVEGFVYDRDATAGAVLALEDATYLDRALTTLTVEQYGRTLTAEARVTRRGLPQAKGYGAGWQPWALEWRAPDPRRYGLSAGDVATGLPTTAGGITLPATLPATLGSPSSAGLIALPNAGRAPYSPVLAIRGPLPNGFEVVHRERGRRLRYVGPIPADEVLTIDSRRRRVRLSGGADRRGFLTVAQWLEVPGRTAAAPGGATLAWSSLGPDLDPAAELRVLTPPSSAHW